MAGDLTTPEAENLKCLGTSAFMSELLTALRERFPKLVFSANGGFNYRRERGQGRAWA